jgi:osmotically-inducible protein OsmY
MLKKLALLLCASALAIACGTSNSERQDLPDWAEPASRDGNDDRAVGTSGRDDDEALTDTAITSEVRASLLGDDRIAPFKIQVRTDNGIVLLNGDVPSRSDAARAVMLAQRAEGVRKVVDNLHVN